jgi:hypothetical protein
MRCDGESCRHALDSNPLVQVDSDNCCVECVFFMAVCILGCRSRGSPHIKKKFFNNLRSGMFELFVM